MPSITQLEYIIAVDKHRHFGRAAQACNVSQPSLSAQIQKVEEELGWQIFDRIKKPVVPTDKGRAYLEQAKVLLHEYQKLGAIGIERGETVQGDFRLGIIPTLSPYLVPRFIPHFADKYPDVKLYIDEMKTETILTALKDDEIDAAILATPLHEKGLKKKVLFYEPFYLLMDRRNELRKKKRVTEDDVSAANMWLLQDGHCFRNQVVRVCSLKDRVSRFKNIHFEGGNLETLKYVIENTEGVTLIPHLFRKTFSDKEADETIREFAPPVPLREISLVFRREQWKQDVLEALRTSIQATLPPELKQDFNRREHKLIGIS